MEHEPKRESLAEAQKRIQELCYPLVKEGHRQLGREFFVRVQNRAKELREAYPDALRRFWYHAMIGSSFNTFPDNLITEDFPGDDSVEQFLRSLAAGE